MKNGNQKYLISSDYKSGRILFYSNDLIKKNSIVHIVTTGASEFYFKVLEIDNSDSTMIVLVGEELENIVYVEGAKYV